MARKATTTVLPSPGTHMFMEFGGWAKFIMPTEAIGALLVLMKDAYQVDVGYVGGCNVYTPKDANISTEWLKVTDVHIPLGTPAKVAKEYILAFKATAELQGDDFTPDCLPFAEWLAAQTQS